VIPDKIDSDPHQPGFDSGVAPELVPRLPRFDHALLGQSLSGVLIPQGSENETVDALLLAFGPETVPGVDAATIVMNLSAPGDLTEAAANLFGYLRALDAKSARAIAVMPVPHHGLGEAINDRLRRAAMGRE